MLLAITLALLAGILVGTITGLFPGIHINLVATILLSSVVLLSFAPPIALALFIVSLSITHIFVDFIPSIYLGAPDDENFLSVLPGHRLLLEGRAHEAIVITLYGALTGIIISMLTAPIFILFLPSFFNAIKFLIPFILIFSSFYLIFTEKEFIISILIFLLAGFLGLAAFRLPIEQPLLPLLTGLFGASSIIISLKQKTIIPKQKILPLNKIFLPRLEFIKSSLSAFIAGPLCSFLPAIGSSQAAILGSQFFKQNDRTFLFIVGAVNIAVMSLSFVTAYAINKTRTGSAAAISQILDKITLSHIVIILISILAVGVIAFVLALNISKFFTKILNKFNYNYISVIVISILLLVNLIFTNWLGLIVLATSTFLGIFCILSNSRRINLMGCLLVPSIIYYLI